MYYIQETISNSGRRTRVITSGKALSLLSQICNLVIYGKEDIKIEKVTNDSEEAIMIHVLRNMDTDKPVETYFTKVPMGKENAVEEELENIVGRIAKCKSELSFLSEVFSCDDKYADREKSEMKSEIDILINGYWAIYNNYQKLYNDSYIKRKYGSMEF